MISENPKEEKIRLNYQQIGARLSEITDGMTSKQVDERWGEGSSRYLQNVPYFMSYLGKELKRVEERKENIPKEFYESTERLSYGDLKKWYENTEGKKGKERKHREIVYIERLLECVAKKFEVDIVVPVKTSKPDRIRTPRDLQILCDSDPKARYLVRLCQGNEIDVADILAVVYDGRITRDEAIKMLQEPSIKDYLGKFRNPGGGFIEIYEDASCILPFDKNDAISLIVEKRLIEYRRSKLGTKPSAKQRADFLREIQEHESSLEKLL